MKENRDARVIAFDEMSLGPFAYLHQVVIGNAYAWKNDYVPDPVLSPDSNQRHERAKFILRSRGKIVEESCLIEPETRQGVRQYSPLNEVGLLNRFLSLKPELNAILRFANQYGLISHKEFLINPSLKEQRVCSGESLGVWHEAINHMKLLDTLWQLVKRKDEQNLAEYIFWERRGERTVRRVSFESHLPYGGSQLATIADEHFRPELLTQWKFGDLISPANFFVHSEINNKIRGHVSPAILPFHKGQIFLIPDCLLSSLYVLLALKVSGQRKNEVKCKGCELYFKPARTDQMYHSAQCRKLHYWHEAESSPKNRRESK
jgi:hypothetical protein